VPTREWVVITAPASKRWPKPAPVPPDCPPSRRRAGLAPSEEETGFRRAVAMIPATAEANARNHCCGPDRGSSSAPPPALSGRQPRWTERTAALTAAARPASLYRCLSGLTSFDRSPLLLSTLSCLRDRGADQAETCALPRFGAVDFKVLLHRRVRSVDPRCQAPAPYPSMGFVSPSRSVLTVVVPMTRTRM